MIRNDATPDTQRKDAAVWFCKYYEFDSILAFTNVDLSSPPPPLAAGKEVDYKEYGKQILKSISDTFLKPENLSKASFNDQAVIQAVGETILNFPLPEPSPPLPVNMEGWVSDRPVNDREFIMVTATLIKDRWNYTAWEVSEIPGEGYFGLCELDGEEWGPYEDLSADLYFILPSPTKTDKI